MKLKLSFLCCILFSFLTVQAQQRPESWQLYNVPGQKFAVALPTLPAMSYYPPANGSRERVMVGAYADGVVYAIEVFENVHQHQSLTSFIEESSQLKFDAATEKEVSVSGVAGKEYSADWPGKYQFFGAQQRLYKFMVLGVPGSDPRAQRFFSSIVFSEKPQGIAVSDGPGTPYQQDSGEPPYVGKDFDSRVRLGMKPEPTYTESARNNLIVGTVVLKVVFTSAGNVSNISVISGLPNGLTERAIEAAKKIKFIPAIKDGHYVSKWMQLEYNFNLY
jgi:TonB family protein